MCERCTIEPHCTHCCIFLWKFVYLYPVSLFVLIKWCTTRTYTIPFFFAKLIPNHIWVLLHSSSTGIRTRLLRHNVRTLYHWATSLLEMLKFMYISKTLFRTTSFQNLSIPSFHHKYRTHHVFATCQQFFKKETALSQRLALFFKNVSEECWFRIWADEMSTNCYSISPAYYTRCI